MKLYSVRRFHSVGSSVKNEQPVLHTEETLPSVLEGAKGYYNPPLNALLDMKPSESSVISYESQPTFTHLIVDGARVTRLPDFAVGALAWDTETKEVVKITNGVCVYDHFSRDPFSITHPNNKPCAYAATEAIAIRAVADRKSGRHYVAWTYRAVQHVNLIPVGEHAEAAFNILMAHANDTARDGMGVGRV